MYDNPKENEVKENEVCQLHEFKKNNYFYGKLMTVSDFETEQSYFDEKRYLINRMLHGSGLICGFKEIKVEKAADRSLKIRFIDGGMALDCYGREIVVLPNSEEKIVNSDGESVSDLIEPSPSYLYLIYKVCYGGYVASASNPSSCEDKCCPGRIVEGYKVIASTKPPELKKLKCRFKSTGESWLEHLEKEKEHRVRPSCADKEYVFLAPVIKDENDNYSVASEDTARKRVRTFFTQEELYQLSKCHILDIENPHAVTAKQIRAMVSINGVCNLEGNVNLIEGSHVSITPNRSKHTIEIASTGGEEPATSVESVGKELTVGESERYSREDHVHNLGDNVVELDNLSNELWKPLELLFTSLRERALKCTVSNFKAIGRQFDNKIAFKIAQMSKDALDKTTSLSNAEFRVLMRDILKLMKEFAESSQERFTKKSIKMFCNKLKKLEQALDSEDKFSIWVAIKQDDVCFYASELEVQEEVSEHVLE